MTTPLVDLAAIHADQALTLVVGWNSGRKVKLRQISIGGDVENAFRNVILATSQTLAQREAQAWTPDADLTPETFLVIEKSLLGPSPVLATEHGENTLATVLATAEGLDAMHPEQLPAGDLSFYAIVAGNTPGQRVAFLRRTNPRRGLRKGRIYTLLSQTLRRLEEPIFAFDPDIDLVFIGDKVCVLSQSVFAALFRDQDALASQIPGWAGQLHTAVPICDDGIARLSNRAKRDTRIRARLEAIVNRGHLSAVTATRLRDEMVRSGLDPTALIDAHGALILDEADIPEVLHFLNEDLFVGSLTDLNFRADKKAVR